ncbi:cation transporter [Azospirillum sp. ST 5-10]|uniref:cation transporter n=1 Tax=unclassified Azospirillum TaxID=2630922 RepID=UPI003F4A5A4F
MKGRDFEFPPHQGRALRRARRLEWWTVAYLLSSIVLMYLVLGQSQAMRTAWYEDILSLIPPAVFLIGSRVAEWKPTRTFPYGWHRATSAAYLAAAAALFAMGGFLAVEAAMTLLSGRHPTIATVSLFGHDVWLGWLMIPALLYSAVPAVILGRMKLPLADDINDKVLYADAQMNKADWMTALAGIVGVLGIGFGFWWADSAAAGVIALDILHDGYRNLRISVADLMDREPRTVDGARAEPLLGRLHEALKRYAWVGAVDVRLRGEGHVFLAEAFVVPRDRTDLLDRVAHLAGELRRLDWRLREVIVVPVRTLPADGERDHARGRAAR